MQGRLVTRISKLLAQIGFCSLLSSAGYASYIESTIGAAVINDATAAYYNPAALVLVKNPQLIPLFTTSRFNTKFIGRTQQKLTGLREEGMSSASSRLYSPSLYLAIPASEHFIFGLAAVSNFANRNADENAILRYVQSNNTIQDNDLVPSLGIKINDYFSVGGGLNLSYANLDLKPITGFPGSNTADSQSRNRSNGTAATGNIGFLLKPAAKTLIGFNYRGSSHYKLSGTSVFNGPPQLVSHNYHFTLQAPARAILSVSHFVNDTLGFITTIQRFEWSALQYQEIYGLATLVGTKPRIINARVPFFLKDSWVVTVGSQYRLSSKWIVRLAGTYNQSPDNSQFQLATGDAIIVGASTGYKINKHITIDGSYAHGFMQDAIINISGQRSAIQGKNSGARNALALKLTYNF